MLGKHALQNRAAAPLGAPMDVLLHELRTPLAAAEYALEALRRRHAGTNQDEDHDEDHDEDADLVRTAQLGLMEAQSIMRWAGQLRAMTSNLQAPAIGPVSVVATVERALRLLPAAAARVSREGLADAPLVTADQIWLTQVFTNLLENAVKHTPPSSAVCVTAQMGTHGQVLIAVHAPGSGIPPAEQEQVFRPYTRQAPSDDLTSLGLGLSIARYFVRGMGGDMWVDSDGHSATTLRFTLPVA
jgi:signal transduction histidine kinase